MENKGKHWKKKVLYNMCLNEFIKETMLTFEKGKTLFDEYIIALPEEVNKLSIALEEKNFETAKHIAHELKGSMANYRLKHLYLTAKNIHDSIADRGEMEQKEMIEKINVEIMDFINTIE